MPTVRQNWASNAGLLETSSIHVAPLYVFEVLTLVPQPLATLSIWGRGLSVGVNWWCLLCRETRARSRLFAHSSHFLHGFVWIALGNWLYGVHRFCYLRENPTPNTWGRLSNGLSRPELRNLAWSSLLLTASALFCLAQSEAVFEIGSLPSQLPDLPSNCSEESC